MIALNNYHLLIESDFQANSYNQMIWEKFFNGSFWYCVQDNETDPIKATGTQQSFFEKIPTFGFELKIDRCVPGQVSIPPLS